MRLAHLFVGGGCSGKVQNMPTARQCEISKKAKKRRNTESAVTPAHGVFRSSNLDTVVGWGWRIFLCDCVVQGRSKTHHLQVNVKSKKKLTKARSLRSLHVRGSLRTQRKAERSGLGCSRLPFSSLTSAHSSKTAPPPCSWASSFSASVPPCSSSQNRSSAARKIPVPAQLWCASLKIYCCSSRSTARDPALGGEEVENNVSLV